MAAATPNIARYPPANACPSRPDWASLRRPRCPKCSSPPGLAAIRIARHLREGTIVATASSEEKRALCREAGATHAIDYRAPDWPAEVRSLLGGCDVIVDSRAGPGTQRQLDLLDNGGRLVLLASHDGALGEVDTRQIVRRRLTLTGSTLRPRTSAFKAALAAALRAEVWPLIESGLIRTHLCATFPLAEAERAHAMLEANRQIGKIVLIVDDALSNMLAIDGPCRIGA